MGLLLALVPMFAVLLPRHDDTCREDVIPLTVLALLWGSSGMVGVGLGLTIAAGVDSRFMSLVLGYILAMLTLLAVTCEYLNSDRCQTLHAAITFRSSPAQLWIVSKIMFKHILSLATRTLQQSVGVDMHAGGMRRLRDGSTVCAMFLFFVDNWKAEEIGCQIVRWLGTAGFIGMEVAFCVLVVKAFLLPLDLAKRAQAEFMRAEERENVISLAYRVSCTNFWYIMGAVTSTAMMMWAYMVLGPLVEIMYGSLPYLSLFFIVPMLVDSITTVLCVIRASGIITRAEMKGEASALAEELRLEHRQEVMREFRDWGLDADPRWRAKVVELSKRGLTLEALLRFYRGLGCDYMPNYQPSRHTTKDVVRSAIIPLSEAERCSYAEILMGGTPPQAQTMVTHSWSSLFRDLVAAVVADALGVNEFGMVADILQWDLDGIESILRDGGHLAKTYWICAFSVSQHDNICGSNPHHDFDPVTLEEYSVCPCGKQKFFNSDGTLTKDGRSIECELNKFDDMMAVLASSDASFKQIIAVDASYGLFDRAWCIAEIAQAFEMGMVQSMQLISSMSRGAYTDKLRMLRIEEMKASRPEDVAEILSKIPDKDAFNARLQDMIFGQSGLLPCWTCLDGEQKLVHIGWWLRWYLLKAGRNSCWLQSSTGYVNAV